MRSENEISWWELQLLNHRKLLIFILFSLLSRKKTPIKFIYEGSLLWKNFYHFVRLIPFGEQIHLDVTISRNHLTIGKLLVADRTSPLSF